MAATKQSKPLARVLVVDDEQDMMQAVNALIEQCGLTGRIPSAVCKPGLYFWEQ